MTWGELDRSWLNKRVTVTWFNDVAVVRRGRVCHDGYYFYISTHSLEQTPPDRALVKEGWE